MQVACLFLEFSQLNALADAKDMLALVAGALFGAYHHGVTVTDAKWQSEWSARDARDAQAKATNEAAERAKRKHVNNLSTR